MARRTASLLVVLALVGGCGGDDDPAPAERQPGGGQAVQARDGVLAVSVVPSGGTAFEQAELRAEPGRITFELTNPSQTSHALCVESREQGTLGCTSQFRGGTASLDLRLARGTYAYFCNVPGHRDAGMVGSLTVG